MKNLLNNRLYRVGQIMGAYTLTVISVMAQAENYSAVLQWSRRVELSTPVSGVIKEVRVEAGERVARGAVLLQLDDEVFKSRVNSAQSSLHNQEEIYKESKREMDRTTELYNRTLLSEHELQTAKNNHARALAEFEKAKTSLTQARQELQYSAIRAPFDAWILARAAEPGKVVSAELKPEPLLVVAAADKMLARILVPESRLATLRKGASVKVVLAGQEVAGTIRTIALEPEQRSSADALRYAVDVEFNSGDKQLRAGQTATVILP